MNVNDGKLQPITPEFSVHQYEIAANDMPALVTPLLVSLDGSRLMISPAVSKLLIRHEAVLTNCFNSRKARP